MAERRSRGDIRNSKLQKVAANLFLKHGYEGVTIDRIVQPWTYFGLYVSAMDD
jgi:AcrR family transcriptional regulator